jgi:hypothetical protein
MVSMDKIFDEVTASTPGLQVELPRHAEAAGNKSAVSFADSVTLSGSDTVTSVFRDKTEIDSQIAKEMARAFHCSVSPRSQDFVRTKFWGNEAPNRQGVQILNSDMGPYWKYFEDECRDYQHSLGFRGNAAIGTWNDLLEIVQMLKTGLLKNEILDVLQLKLAGSIKMSDEHLVSSINLAARLLLMIGIADTKELRHEPNPILWRSGSLKYFVKDQLTPPALVLPIDGGRLGTQFTARNLERIAGLKIAWTNNLTNHLRISSDDSQIYIFHHASFLECQRQRRATIFHS